MNAGICDLAEPDSCAGSWHAFPFPAQFTGNTKGAMGITGADVAKSAADMVLTDDILPRLLPRLNRGVITSL